MTATESIAPSHPVTRLSRQPWGLYAAIALAALLAIAAIAPQLLMTHDPFALDYAASLKAPSLAHVFGTDESGRDLYSRVVYGARESLLIGLGAAGVGIVLSLVLGSLAALGTKPVAFVVDRFIEVMFSFPALLLALLLIAIT
jgi:peptide/nickel transport system permease protein